MAHQTSRASIIIAGVMTPTEYVDIHRWIKGQLGTPSLCENCGTTEAKQFDWANLSNEYKQDTSDWARLCKSCHNLIDGGARATCKRGHLYTYINNRRVCRACRRVRYFKSKGVVYA